MVADANQVAGRQLGFLNPMLYSMAANVPSDLFHDITSGNNGFNGVPGYDAIVGWDLASGWGTPSLGQAFWQLRNEQ
jgi:hypothetical protein